MEKTPAGMCKHIGIFGDTNAGKSTLMNGLLGEEVSIVSSQRGTTTDPVRASMELLPHGPVVLIDTAGTRDPGKLAQKRLQKTNAVVHRCDVALHLTDARDALERGLDDFESSGTVIRLLTKSDLLSETQRGDIQRRFLDALLVDVTAAQDIERIKKRLLTALQQSGEEKPSPLIADRLPAGADVVLVVPIDSEAPAGRLILPQVQLIRELLDFQMNVHVCRESELTRMLAVCTKVDLVVTDSQAFGVVDALLPRDIPLTSFSVLLARQKGDLLQQIRGATALDALNEGDRVLILEACKHSAGHEDIGRVKIPALLRKKAGGKAIEFDFRTGYDMPDDLSAYAAAILCGSCMISKAEVGHRLRLFEDLDLPVSNYGLVIAHCHGILARATEIFQRG